MPPTCVPNTKYPMLKMKVTMFRHQTTLNHFQEDTFINVFYYINFDKHVLCFFAFVQKHQKVAREPKKSPDLSRFLFFSTI